jgi:hypothetical protein
MLTELISVDYLIGYERILDYFKQLRPTPESHSSYPTRWLKDYGSEYIVQYQSQHDRTMAQATSRNRGLSILAVPAPGNGHKITDWEKFRDFVSSHGDKTQVEMAKLWDGAISDRTISRALKKIGFTRKKRLMATAIGMRPRDKLS